MHLKKQKIGVMAPLYTTPYNYTYYELIGVITRSGKLNQIGHFSLMEVSVNGKKKVAMGAEDRIYPFHSIKLEPGENIPKLDLIAGYSSSVMYTNSWYNLLFTILLSSVFSNIYLHCNFPLQ